MAEQPDNQKSPDVSLVRRRRLVFGELRDGTLWLIRLRWWVPPSIAAGVAAAHALGLEFEAIRILLVAGFILIYNAFLHRVSRGVAEEPPERDGRVRRFTHCQVALDLLAVFVLIHFTGGPVSPLVFLLVTQVVFASVLLPPRSAHAFAGLAAAGMVLVVVAEHLGWASPVPILFRGKAIALPGGPIYTGLCLLTFASSVFLSVFSTTAVMSVLRVRIADLVSSLAEIEGLSEKSRTLYIVVQAIVAKQRLDQVLHIAKTELARVMGVQAISVKLLSEDRRFLRFAAAHGLPESLVKNEIDIWKSPLNRRVILGEMFVTGRFSEREKFQFGEDFAAIGLHSVLLVPLKAEFDVIGVLGAYSTRTDQFEEEDVEFFRLAADLVAIAIANARAYEAVETLMQERSQFMLQIAHNLRAPLAATISMVEVVQGGYLGELNEKQSEHLVRIDRRAKSMASMINELLALARSRAKTRKAERASVDLKVLARKLERTFQDEAAEKGLALEVVVPEDLPETTGDAEMLEQMLENLISNAVKYTRAGSVRLAFAVEPDGMIRIEIQDTGIGIPKESMPRLFTEFYRASNARSVEADGTGLGLALVKETVDQHRGRVRVESEEGRGTVFIVHLPTSKPDIELEVQH